MTTPHSENPSAQPAEVIARRETMATLAHADRSRLQQLLEASDLPKEHSLLRQPETGLIMARGRMGGTGNAFNIGEVTVTRCTVRLSGGETGSAYILGRSKNHALNAALVDALWQHPDHQETVETTILAPLRAENSARRTRVREETAATKVDFFTMVRGED